MSERSTPEGGEIRDLEPVLERVDPSRRDFLRRVVITSAFAAPVVASFSISELSVKPAMAQGSNFS